MTSDQFTPMPPAEIAKLLLENQKENDAFIRHYEDVRFKITQVTVTLAGLLIGALRFGPRSLRPVANLPVALFVIILGIIGILISAKYSERADRHATIARAYRRAVSALVGKIEGREIEEIHESAVSQHAASTGLTRLMYAIRARYFWYAVHSCIILLGILITFIFRPERR